ncbi:MAG: hypothetical protein QXI19_10150 [Candidatus Caldarchaeum sp.]
MVRGFRVKAYAKINWFLSVGGIMDKESSGRLQPRSVSNCKTFHEVRTFYQLVDLYDEVVVRPSDELRVIMEGCDILENENLVSKGLSFLQEHVKLPAISITIKKRIPLQAGLGGGSSDAGTVLWFLQSVLRLPVSMTAFLEIASVLGSDVPFFFMRIPSALGSGRGDILQPVAPLPPKILVLAKPETGIRSTDAYRRLDEAGGGTFLPFPSSFQKPHNDFDKVAPSESLLLMKRLRDAGARNAHLCGSGSAVFGEFTSREEAAQLVARLQEEGVWAHQCQTITSVAGVEWMDSF